ncbi:MAG: GIY-YIG nuclease family protein [Proteobacteria bacterium]|nr:GIY-YIG nuclease family protein [Pseudomonadota bacterium]MBU1546848.1 GIY-YIG nuclease family protein [Pseudomonadota bacterium]MBU2618862.1 GIY-YIG nuclease family protein [Pseudomonadota bacterium]
MGKQIRIYLADNSASGVRHAEITNWTGQAFACPRTRFNELKDWPEIKRPGVYFLFGINETTGDNIVYIGESENVLDRLNSHISGKDFWSELIAFTSKDENLTKSHAKYLESRLVSIATHARRYEVKNSAAPQPPTLSRGERDAMEEFLLLAKLLLGVLGHRVLDPYAPVLHRPAKEEMQGEYTLPQSSAISLEVSPLTNTTILKLRDKKYSADAIITDEGMVVLAGSQATKKPLPSLARGYLSLRENLIAKGVLSENNDILVFTQDQLFSSPSQAASIILGSSRNGPKEWGMQLLEPKCNSDELLRELESSNGDRLTRDYKQMETSHD